MTVLALAQGTFSAVFGPSGAAEASDFVLIHAGLGHVISDSVGQARVRDASRTALPLWNHSKLAVRHRRTRHRPAVHLSMHALTLLAVFHPGFSIAVNQQTVLVQALGTQAGIAFRTAHHIHCGILTVAYHSSTHHQP